MYFMPPIKPMIPENGRRTPIVRAKPRDAFCPIRNIKTFFKKRNMVYRSCKRGAIRRLS